MFMQPDLIIHFDMLT